MVCNEMTLEFDERLAGVSKEANFFCMQRVSVWIQVEDLRKQPSEENIGTTERKMNRRVETLHVRDDIRDWCPSPTVTGTIKYEKVILAGHVATAEMTAKV
jgi:hypothetical protein